MNTYYPKFKQEWTKAYPCRPRDYFISHVRIKDRKFMPSYEWEGRPVMSRLMHHDYLRIWSGEVSEYLHRRNHCEAKVKIGPCHHYNHTPSRVKKCPCPKYNVGYYDVDMVKQLNQRRWDFVPSRVCHCNVNVQRRRKCVF